MAKFLFLKTHILLLQHADLFLQGQVNQTETVVHKALFWTSGPQI